MKRRVFADVIIAVCVVAIGFVTVSVVWEYHRLGTAMPAEVVTALLRVWGGELLIIALRQIFGSDVTRHKDSASEHGSV